MKPEKGKADIAICLLRLTLAVCALIPAVLIPLGCNPGIIAVLSTPTSDEVDNSEYKLHKEKEKKILVLVDQPSYLSDYPNLRFYLTNITNKLLREKAKIKPSFLIDYSAVADLRVGTPDFSILSPAQIGEKLGADLVLSITITNCKIRDISDSSHVEGSLDAQASLYKVSSGEKLWPTTEQSRLVQVGFESERRGRDAAVMRLAAAAAHCVTRYLYNCPKSNFKISDERAASGW